MRKPIFIVKVPLMTDKDGEELKEAMSQLKDDYYVFVVHEDVESPEFQM